MRTPREHLGTRRARVLHFADIINRHDFIDVVLEHLDRERFEPMAVTYRPSNIAPHDLDARRIPWWDLGPPGGPAAALRLTFALRRILRRERVDIIHTHHYWPALIGTLAAVATPTRVVIGRHYADAIFLNTRGLRRWAYLAIERSTYAGCAAVVCPSTMIVGMLARSGVPAGRVFNIPYSFAPEKFLAPDGEDPSETRAEVGLGPDGFVIGTFGRLYKDKGHRYLADAVARLRHDMPELRWLIVGEGEERERLQSQVSRLGIEDITVFAGWRTDAPRLMRAVDAVVQPTLQEAFSSVVAEAMWTGRPLVVSDVSGVRDLVLDGVNGSVVRPRDVDALCAAVGRLLVTPDLASARARVGSEWVRSALVPSLVVPQVACMYESVVDAGELAQPRGDAGPESAEEVADHPRQRLPAAGRVVRLLLRSGLRGRTRVTLLLAERLTSLQALPLPAAHGRTLYADLRLGSTHGLLCGEAASTGEEEVMRALVKPGDTVLDVGAHIGVFTLLLAELAGPAGQVHAFEPNTGALGSLARTVSRLPNVALHAVALSDEVGSAELVVPGDPSMASLVDWTAGRHGKTHMVRCELNRLDDLVGESTVAQPNFIKCDVEGAELRVFRGARETLNRTDAPTVLFEANVSSARAFGVDVSAAMAFLGALPMPRYEFFRIAVGGLEGPIGAIEHQHSNVLAVPLARRHDVPRGLIGSSDVPLQQRGPVG